FAKGRPCALKQLPPQEEVPGGLSVPQHPRCHYQLAPATDRRDECIGRVSRWLVSQPRIAEIELLRGWPIPDRAESWPLANLARAHRSTMPIVGPCRLRLPGTGSGSRGNKWRLLSSPPCPSARAFRIRNIVLSRGDSR